MIVHQYVGFNFDISGVYLNDEILESENREKAKHGTIHTEMQANVTAG